MLSAAAICACIRFPTARVSNVRSTSRKAATEPVLPFGVPEAPAEPARRGRRQAARGTEFVHRLGSDALASHGLPAGTRLVVDTTQKPRRGQILFVRTQGRLRVGVLEVQFGRSVLRSDHGTFWLDPATEIWGVAVAADPPLDGLAW
jgi:hypothetical protein